MSPPEHCDKQALLCLLYDFAVLVVNIESESVEKKVRNFSDASSEWRRRGTRLCVIGAVKYQVPLESYRLCVNCLYNYTAEIWAVKFHCSMQSQWLRVTLSKSTFSHFLELYSTKSPNYPLLTLPDII